MSFSPLLEDDDEVDDDEPSNGDSVTSLEVMSTSNLLRGILKRPRCFSESSSQKSVRFNEVVQRQVYRSNSSILGQKAKNLKKAEQKRRRAAEKRRLSEGDASSFMSSCGDDSDAEEMMSTKNDDSGVASSLDESGRVNNAGLKTKSKKVVKKSSAGAMKKSVDCAAAANSDLIFNLDF